MQVNLRPGDDLEILFEGGMLTLTFLPEDIAEDTLSIILRSWYGREITTMAERENLVLIDVQPKKVEADVSTQS